MDVVQSALYSIFHAWIIGAQVMTITLSGIAGIWLINKALTK